MHIHTNPKTNLHAIYKSRSGLPPRVREPRLRLPPYKHYNMLGPGVLSLRYASRSLALSRTLRYQQYQPTRLRDARTFSTTPRRLASEVPDDFIDTIKHTELFKKLADKPKALKALSDLYELTKEMGAVFPFRFFLAQRMC
jgi:hypothetical protein